MPRQLTEDDARQSLANHVAEKGQQVYLKYGPEIGWNNLQELLADRTLVRYPCEIAFDAASLQPGEFACAIGKTENPEDGFTIYVHPYFALEPNRVAHMVLYHLVVVNYGDMATAVEAETFGAAALGLLKDEYYSLLCQMADAISQDPRSAAN
jgi:hypothetical protein